MFIFAPVAIQLFARAGIQFGETGTNYCAIKPETKFDVSVVYRVSGYSFEARAIIHPYPPTPTVAVPWLYHEEQCGTFITDDSARESDIFPHVELAVLC